MTRTHLPLLLLFAFISFAATAQVKRSSRNLEPLTKKTPAADARSGTSATAGATPAQKSAQDDQDAVTRVTFIGPKKGWGFLQTASPHYSVEGKNLGPLSGGTLFTYSDVKTTSKNAVLVSRVKRGDAWEGPFLLDCTAVAAYEGTPETVDPQTVRKLADYFTLKGKIEDRKEALAEASAAANPHFESARQAQQAYQQSIEKAADMEQQMNALTGARKSKALEALRAYKYEQVRIKAKADQEALAYKTWKEAHPADPAKLAADPQLQALEQELRAAAAKIPHLIPPAS